MSCPVTSSPACSSGSTVDAVGIQLTTFWLRRARRLLLALLLVLIAVTLLVRFADPAGLYPDFRMSALSALFYFSNWWQIAVSGNYFVATGPVSPLTHTWSLAVEEQFYLVWPFVVLAVMGLARTFARGIRALLVLSLVGALASALEMALLYNPSTGNDTRIYFGTDTHAQSILVGSALACLLTIVQMNRGHDGMDPAVRSRAGRWTLIVLGMVGLLVLIVLSSLLEGTSWLAYRGGFALSAALAAAVIAAVVCVPDGLMAKALSNRPLVWLGTISYGVYLWHYPVFVFVDNERTGLAGPSLLLLRTVVTLGLASASFYLVERPVIEGSSGGRSGPWSRRPRSSAPPRQSSWSGRSCRPPLRCGCTGTGRPRRPRPHRQSWSSGTARPWPSATRSAPLRRPERGGERRACSGAVWRSVPLSPTIHPPRDYRWPRRATRPPPSPGSGRRWTHGRSPTPRLATSSSSLAGTGRPRTCPSGATDQHRGGFVPALRAVPDADGSADRHRPRGPLRLCHHGGDGRGHHVDGCPGPPRFLPSAAPLQRTDQAGGRRNFPARSA